MKSINSLNYCSSMGSSYFITGIGTDIGKTIVSAILTEALHADYWKPIQAGNLGNPDPSMVADLISNRVSAIHPSAYSLSTGASPHYAAEKDGIEIDLQQIKPPLTNNKLIIEGAGGLMVPLNKNELVIDLIIQLKVPVILVVKNYLGAINHSLLSIEILQQKNIPITGIVYNEGTRSENIRFIEDYTGINTLGIVPRLEVLNKAVILKEAAKFASLKNFV